MVDVVAGGRAIPVVAPPRVSKDAGDLGKPGESVRFLRAEVPKERIEWLELWKSWPGREIMAHPDYARLFARPGDQVVGAIRETAEGGILHPVILRPLAAEPWAKSLEGAYDATTPYGFGGPFGWGVTAAEASQFWKLFDAWAVERRVITSFARLPLFPDACLPHNGLVEVNGPCVVRRLDLPEEEIWADYAPKVRQNVQRARRLGLTVEPDPSGKRLDEFLAVYVATMKRRSADLSYYFPRAFFESIQSDLKGHSAFFHLLAGGRVIASELVLFAGGRAYSFLGGSFEEAFSLRANELLKHESFMWCRAAGNRSIILGGGYRGQDGILRFKRTFASTGEVSFRLGKKTYDAELRDRCVRERCEWERSRGVPWQTDPGYFPPYRS